MNKKLTWLLVCGLLIGTASMHSQPLSIRLKCIDTVRYPVIVEAESWQLTKWSYAHPNVKIGSRKGDFHTLYAYPQDLKQLYQESWIRNISDGGYKLVPLLDTSRIVNRIYSVHSGEELAGVSYKGNGVLVGIIDFGIDWRHPDFGDSSGTRILRLWDQNKDSIGPTRYNYGHVWYTDDIDNKRCTHQGNIDYGHGTAVAGIAAGNGTISKSHTGIAPESKLLIVSIKNNQAWTNHLIDAIDWMDRIADSLNMPLVINISLGSYDGSHDGKDPSTRMIEQYLTKPGRSIVAAAGNAGHIAQHIEYVPEGDTLFTDFEYNSSLSGVYFNFWADTQNARNLKIGLQSDSSNQLIPKMPAVFFDFGHRFLDSLIHYGYYEDSIVLYNWNGEEEGRVNFYVLKQENTLNFQCYIQPRVNSRYWRLMIGGHGRADLWCNSSLQTSSNALVSSLPTASSKPEMAKYRYPDNRMSIVSGFQCSEHIITVGNYINQHGYYDIDSVYRRGSGLVGNIYISSSLGPTRDLRQKPDIAASGTMTITAIDSTTSENFKLSSTNRRKLALGGQYALAGGTSMASPVVAGAVGLLLQKNKNLTPSQILYLLKKTAYQDTFTGASPNNTFGNGKLDGLALMRYQPKYGCPDTGSINYDTTADFEDYSLCIRKVYGCIDTASINYDARANIDNGSCIRKVYGCTDTASINYDARANIDNGSCIRKVYGCMDSTAVNYNPMANVSNDSCEYTNEIIKTPNSNDLRAFPNPTSDMVRLNVIEEYDYEIFSISGQSLIIGQIDRSRQFIDMRSLIDGIYMIRLSNDLNSIILKVKVQK